MYDEMYKCFQVAKEEGHFNFIFLIYLCFVY